MRMCILFLLDTVFGWETHLPAENLKKAGILPWIGVLKVRSGNKEYATGLTVIAEDLALASADDLTKLDKQTLSISTKAIFFKHNTPFYCDVKDVEIHPEYNNDTLLNTLSVINLDCGKKILWTPIILPIHKRFSKNIYAIGFNDRNYDFEQIVYRMKFINSSKCRDFYIKEEIDFKNLWPEHYICYKTVDIKRQCVFDSGMSLVSINKGNWTLIGISVLGPGCVLPSRYIDIFHYLPWMTKQINKHQLSYRRQLENKEKDENNEDKTDKDDVTAIDPSKNIVDDVGIREDDFYVEKLNSTTMVLRPKYAHIKEVVHGDCMNNDGVIMYRDAGIVRTSQKKPATGTYALSLYDLFFYDVKCVMVSVRCDRRTLTKFWFDKGFKTDNMEELIKVVPQNKRGQGVPPKILYITDSFFNYEHIKTSNLVFKFEFTRQATINVDFYGTLATTTPTSTTTTTTTRRSRGTHRYHLYRTRGYYISVTMKIKNIYNKRKKITRTRKRFNLSNRL